MVKSFSGNRSCVLSVHLQPLPVRLDLQLAPGDGHDQPGVRDLVRLQRGQPFLGQPLLELLGRVHPLLQRGHEVEQVRLDDLFLLSEELIMILDAVVDRVDHTDEPTGHNMLLCHLVHPLAAYDGLHDGHNEGLRDEGYVYVTNIAPKIVAIYGPESPACAPFRMDDLVARFLLYSYDGIDDGHVQPHVFPPRLEDPAVARPIGQTGIQFPGRNERGGLSLAVIGMQERR